MEPKIIVLSQSLSRIIIMIRPGVKLTFDRRHFNRLKMNTALDEELGSLKRRKRLAAKCEHQSWCQGHTTTGNHYDIYSKIVGQALFLHNKLFCSKENRNKFFIFLKKITH